MWSGGAEIFLGLKYGTSCHLPWREEFWGGSWAFWKFEDPWPEALDIFKKKITYWILYKSCLTFPVLSHIHPLTNRGVCNVVDEFSLIQYIIHHSTYSLEIRYFAYCVFEMRILFVLDAFAQSRKAPVSFVMFVCPHVSTLLNFSWSLVLGVMKKSVDKIQIWFKSGNKCIGQFT